MRLLFWRKPHDPGPTAPPTPFDRWLLYARLGAWGLTALLFAATILPLTFDLSAANDGADINLKTEFYTAMEKGGGFLTYDFSPSAAKVLRQRVDTNGDGLVDDREFLDYQNALKENVKGLLVVRSFQITGARVDEWSGLTGSRVNDTAPAHVHLTIGGIWVEHDADVALSRGPLVTVAFGNLTGTERINDRTVIINGGLATMTPTSGNARTLRVPGGIVLVSSYSYAASAWNDTAQPDVRFIRFSVLDSSLLLLAPLAIAYFLGVGGARREQEATRQARVVPFHRALSALFLLLLIVYFGGIMGPVIWGGGIALGVGGLMAAFRFYPADRRPEPLPGASVSAPAPEAAAEGGTGAGWEPVAVHEESAAASGIAAAAALLSRAHTPLEIPDASRTLPRALSPLDLPDGDTPRPEGREAAKPSVRAPLNLAAAKGPEADPGAPAPLRIRCPGCKHYFEAQGSRPLSVTCPHCGRRGVLR